MSVDKTFPKNFLTLIMAAYFFLKKRILPPNANELIEVPKELLLLKKTRKQIGPPK